MFNSRSYITSLRSFTAFSSYIVCFCWVFIHSMNWLETVETFWFCSALKSHMWVSNYFSTTWRNHYHFLLESCWQLCYFSICLCPWDLLNFSDMWVYHFYPIWKKISDNPVKFCLLLLLNSNYTNVCTLAILLEFTGASLFTQSSFASVLQSFLVPIDDRLFFCTL